MRLPATHLNLIVRALRPLAILWMVCVPLLAWYLGGQYRPLAVIGVAIGLAILTWPRFLCRFLVGVLSSIRAVLRRLFHLLEVMLFKGVFIPLARAFQFRPF